jgi:hypothetical protein
MQLLIDLLAACGLLGAIDKEGVSEERREVSQDQFVVEVADETLIRIRDLSTSARFLFAINDRKFDGIPGTEGNLLGSVRRNRARSFALEEARERGLID